MAKSNSKKILSDEEDVAIEFKAPQQFNDYSMVYLKKQIIFKFMAPIEISKSMYNFNMSDISESDRKRLVRILRLMDRKLDFDLDSTFINGKKAVFEDENREETTIEDDDVRLFHTKLTILGYKSNKDKVLSPIWRIRDAQVANEKK